MIIVAFLYSMVNKDVAVNMNIGGLSHYSSELKFVDIAKLSRSWITKRTSGNNSNMWDTHEQHLVNWRNGGYPASLPGIHIAHLSLQKGFH